MRWSQLHTYSLHFSNILNMWHRRHLIMNGVRCDHILVNWGNSKMRMCGLWGQRYAAVPYTVHCTRSCTVHYVWGQRYAAVPYTVHCTRSCTVHYVWGQRYAAVPYTNYNTPCHVQSCVLSGTNTKRYWVDLYTYIILQKPLL